MTTAAATEQRAERQVELDPTMRALMLAGGPINAFGALCFAPPLPWMRELFGLPAGHAVYLWMLSLWIAAFGVGYYDTGRTGRADRSFVAVGAAGKATFSLVLIAMAAAGELPAIAVVVGLPDLALAAYFTRWLLATRA